MFQHNSQTGMDQAGYKNGFPFMASDFGKEGVEEIKAEPVAPMGISTVENAIIQEAAPHVFANEEMIPLWPSLTEMIQTMGKDYQWKQELENMLIVRSLVSGAVIIMFMALGLLLLSM